MVDLQGGHGYLQMVTFMKEHLQKISPMDKANLCFSNLKGLHKENLKKIGG